MAKKDYQNNVHSKRGKQSRTGKFRRQNLRRSRRETKTNNTPPVDFLVHPLDTAPCWRPALNNELL